MIRKEPRRLHTLKRRFRPPALPCLCQGQVESLPDSFCQVGQFLDLDPERAIIALASKLNPEIVPVLIDV